MKKRIAVGIGVLALGTTLVFALPHEGHGGPGGRHGRPSFVEMLGDKLNLTDAQKQQITDIEKASQDANAAFLASARQTMEQIHAAREANDTAKLDSLEPIAEANRAQMKQIHEAVKTKIDAVLTAEQRAQLQAIQAEREAHHKDHPRD